MDRRAVLIAGLSLTAVAATALIAAGPLEPEDRVASTRPSLSDLSQQISGLQSQLAGIDGACSGCDGQPDYLVFNGIDEEDVALISGPTCVRRLLISIRRNQPGLIQFELRTGSTIVAHVTAFPGETTTIELGATFNDLSLRYPGTVPRDVIVTVIRGS